MNEEFEIIGSKHSINKIAKTINTIPYEILTNLGKDTKEDIYFKNGKYLFIFNQ